MMERTTVVIVGAGPSGLAMGLALAKHRVKVFQRFSKLQIRRKSR